MVIGWFTKLAVVAAILGVLGFDTISVVADHVGAREDASNAATDAATAWRGAGGATDPTAAMRAATAAADARLVEGESLVPDSIQVASDGELTLTVRRTVQRTLVAHDIGALHRVLTFDTTATAAPASSSS